MYHWKIQHKCETENTDQKSVSEMYKTPLHLKKAEMLRGRPSTKKQNQPEKPPKVKQTNQNQRKTQTQANNSSQILHIL